MSENGSVRNCVHCGLPVRRPTRSPAFCCLGCRLAWEIHGAEGDEAQARWVQARFLLAALFGMAVMMISLILYTDEVFGAGLDASELGQLFRWAAMTLSAPILLLLAPSLFDRETHGWHRFASLDLWILVAVSAAWILSAGRVLLGTGALYFDSAAMVLILVTLGRLLDARCKLRVGQSAEELRHQLPDHARRLGPDGGLESVRLADIEPGERLRVLAGERVPLDCRVTKGRSHVDMAWVTGEHRPCSLGPGDEVPGGALVSDGVLELEVSRRSGHGMLDQIQHALANARAKRTPAMRTADRLAAVLLPTALLLAIATVVAHGFYGQWEAGLVRGLSVLLVSCPCALGIATPLATWSAVEQAMRMGVLVRDGAAFERMARVNTAVFDKTGTLTEGRLQLAHVYSERLESKQALSIGAALASGNRHPCSQALSQERPDIQPAEEARVLAGLGVTGNCQGQEWLLGNRRLLREKEVVWTPDYEQEWLRAERDGLQVLALARPGQRVEALFFLRESLRPKTLSMMSQLRDRNLSLHVLSGDHRKAVERLSAQLDTPAESDLLPLEKVDRIANLSATQGPLIYVGDGVNDAPALARADVSATLASGTDMASAASDLVLLHDDLSVLPRFFDLSRATMTRIRFNLVWAMLYNPLFLFLAMTGRLSPVWCALAMSLSSLLVAGVSIARPVQPRTPASVPESPWEPAPNYS